MGVKSALFNHNTGHVAGTIVHVMQKQDSKDDEWWQTLDLFSTETNGLVFAFATLWINVHMNDKIITSSFTSTLRNNIINNEILLTSNDRFRQVVLSSFTLSDRDHTLINTTVL